MINIATVVGRLTADVELQKTTTGKSVSKFTIACERPKSKEGEKTTDFVRCAVWNKPAETLSQYGKKGQFIGVIGKVTSYSYEDKKGNKVSGMELLVSEIQLIGGQKPQQMQVNPVEQNWQTPKEPENDFPEITEADLPF